MQKPSVVRLDPPYKTIHQVLVSWRWVCPNHNINKKKFANGDHPTREGAIDALFDHLVRFHPEYHACRHCGAKYDRLELIEEKVLPKPRRSYRCRQCGYYFQVIMGPERPVPKTQWPPGSGEYPWARTR